MPHPPLILDSHDQLLPGKLCSPVSSRMNHAAGRSAYCQLRPAARFPERAACSFASVPPHCVILPFVPFHWPPALI